MDLRAPEARVKARFYEIIQSDGAGASGSFRLAALEAAPPEKVNQARIIPVKLKNADTRNTADRPVARLFRDAVRSVW